MDGYIQRLLSEVGCVHQFPFEIESVRLKNVGPFADFSINFRKNSLNVICGPFRSGSWIMQSILYASGIRENYGGYEALEKGMVTLKRTEGQCLTVDEFSMKPLLLNELQDHLKDMQIIASVPLTFNTKMLDERAVLICLEK
jgi:hypothetical protein